MMIEYYFQCELNRDMLATCWAVRGKISGRKAHAPCSASGSFKREQDIGWHTPLIANVQVKKRVRVLLGARRVFVHYFAEGETF